MDRQTIELFRRKLLTRRQSVRADARAVARIQASLERIDQGTFGNCIICHGALETERLRAMPDAERCAGCTH